MRKWNFLFVNGCEYKNPIPADTKLVGRCHKCFSVHGDHVESNNTEVEYVRQEVGCGYMDWIGLAQDRDRWRTLVGAVMNLGVP